jgi:HAD superfamily hydrolase (TIGR01549 family)
MNPKKLFIFDLDGTIADAYTAIWKSLNFTRKKFKLKPISYNEVKRKVGRGDRLFMEVFFPKDMMERALIIYKKHHKKSLARYSKQKKNARKVLNILNKRSKLLAIASNRPYYFTVIILKSLDMKKYFDIVACADRVRSIKPKPGILYYVLRKLRVKKQDAVFVGDMDIDMETAERAGMDAIFITGGSSSLSAVKKYKNKKVIRSLEEILKLSS